MKKLFVEFMFLLAFCLTSNCASVSWQSGVVFGPSDNSGTLIANAKYKISDDANASMYLFVLGNENEYNKTLEHGIWNTYGSKLDSATASTSSILSSKFGTLTSSGHSSGSTVYGIVIFTFEDAFGKNWYLENSAKVSINDMGSDASIGNMARYVGGFSSQGQLQSWGAYSVPEPSSGIMLLFGLVFMMLRRKNDFKQLRLLR